MKRILISYQKLPTVQLEKLIQNFPHGYGDDDVITLKTASGQLVEVVELKTEDVIYLVKIGKDFGKFLESINKLSNNILPTERKSTLL